MSIGKEILNPEDFMFTFDLKSGYDHVEIFPEHRKYLSFGGRFPQGTPGFSSFLFSRLASVLRLIYLLNYSSL